MEIKQTILGFMELRDYFAGCVLQGLIISEIPLPEEKNRLQAYTEWAYQFADAMLKEREKEVISNKETLLKEREKDEKILGEYIKNDKKLFYGDLLYLDDKCIQVLEDLGDKIIYIDEGKIYKIIEKSKLKIPLNKETLEAMAEADDIINGKKDEKSYTNFNDMIKDALNE